MLRICIFSFIYYIPLFEPSTYVPRGFIDFNFTDIDEEDKMVRHSAEKMVYL